MTDAPFPETGGARAALGFVKGNPSNNDYYVELWKEDPWYPAIKNAHDELTRLFPGYNISQIKEKFGGLRFYIDSGTAEKWDIEKASQITYRAEAWVDGYEAGVRNSRGK